MELENIQAGDQISAAELRRLAQMVRLNQLVQTQGSSIGLSRSAGGTALVPDDADTFTARITTVVSPYSTGYAPQYGFQELW